MNLGIYPRFSFEFNTDYADQEPIQPVQHAGVQGQRQSTQCTFDSIW